MIGLITLLASAPSIGIGIEDASRVSTATAAQIAHALAGSIERRAGVGSSIDEPVWTSCAGQPCAAEIRARSDAAEVVLLRIYGGVTKIRVVAERYSNHDLPASRAEVDIPLSSRGWAEPLAQLAAELFPAAVAFGSRSAIVEAPPRAPSRAIPIALLVCGIGLAAGGVTFVALSQIGAADPPTALMLERADARADYDLLAGGILLGAGVVSLGTSLLLWLLH